MRVLRPALGLVFVLGVFGPGLPSLQCAGLGLFRNLWGDVLVSTDTTPEGHALTPPTRDKPVYYLGRSLGCKLGSIPGDQLPGDREMNHFIAKVLAKQGYLGASPGVHDPALYLVVQWGYLKPGSGDLLWFLGYDASQDIASPSFPGVLGPEVFLRDFRSHSIQTILDDASDAIYGIIVTAFEYKSANTPKPIIYWQTRIGLPANGKSMTQALPTMLLAAGTAIGRESKSPILADADSVREGRIKLGELQILDVINDPADGTDSKEKR
jgi:hypothetical protein